MGARASSGVTGCVIRARWARPEVRDFPDLAGERASRRGGHAPAGAVGAAVPLPRGARARPAVDAARSAGPWRSGAFRSCSRTTKCSALLARMGDGEHRPARPACSTAPACASLEGVRLRVKDVDFERQVVIVREGKGAKDRVVMLPRVARCRRCARSSRDARRLWAGRPRSTAAAACYMPRRARPQVPARRRVAGLVLGLPAGAPSAVDPRSGAERRHHAARPDASSATFKRARRARRHRQAGDAAHAAPFVRHPPAAGRLRHPHRAGTARPRRREHDHDLHPRAEARRRRGAQPARRLMMTMATMPARRRRREPKRFRLPPAATAPRPRARLPVLPRYAELHCRSNFSFLTGASHPEELVERAAALGYGALAITDECSLAGVVRAHVEAQAQKLPLIIGSEMRLSDAETGAPHARLVLLAQTRRGYGNLVALDHGRAPPGREGPLPRAPGRRRRQGAERADARRPARLPGACWCLRRRKPFEAEILAHAMWLKTWFQERAAIAARAAASRRRRRPRRHVVERVAQFTGLPIVAAGDVLMHVRSRKPLQDTLTATRLAKPGRRVRPARSSPTPSSTCARASRLAALYEPEWLEQHDGDRRPLQLLARRAELRVPAGDRARRARRRPRTCASSPTRACPGAFPRGLPDEYRRDRSSTSSRSSPSSQYEALLPDRRRHRALGARAGASCARAAAAPPTRSSATACGVTEVDPRRATLLFERFISVERNEPPDIDIDFEHQRREEVIQYIYGKYGRHRAALTAVVISYRPRSALRDVGRALGIDLQRIEAVSKSQHWFDGRGIAPERLRENGFDPEAPVVKLWIELTRAADRLPAPPVAAPGRLRHRASGRIERAGAGRERGDGRPQRHPVGQGRPRRARPAQGRHPRARHAERDPALRSSSSAPSSAARRS